MLGCWLSRVCPSPSHVSTCQGALTDCCTGMRGSTTNSKARTRKTLGQGVPETETINFHESCLCFQLHSRIARKELWGARALRVLSAQLNSSGTGAHGALAESLVGSAGLGQWDGFGASRLEPSDHILHVWFLSMPFEAMRLEQVGKA